MKNLNKVLLKMNRAEAKEVVLTESFWNENK